MFLFTFNAVSTSLSAKVDDSMPIHAVSPTYSTNVPHPPRVTPAATSPLTGTAITSGSSEKAGRPTSTVYLC